MLPWEWITFCIKYRPLVVDPSVVTSPSYPFNIIQGWFVSSHVIICQLIKPNQLLLHISAPPLVGSLHSPQIRRRSDWDNWQQSVLFWRVISITAVAQILFFLKFLFLGTLLSQRPPAAAHQLLLLQKLSRAAVFPPGYFSFLGQGKEFMWVSRKALIASEGLE